MLREERGGYVELDDSSALDWTSLRARIKQHGMRNSNCVAIAQQQQFQILLVCLHASNRPIKICTLNRIYPVEFTVVNDHLVRDLKKLGPLGRSHGR